MCIMVGLSTSLSRAESRTALVIGCSYEGTPIELPSPVGDATRVAAMLSDDSLEFNTTLLTNPSRIEMIEALNRFGEILERDKGIGLFYFSGHGSQHEGLNYLLPSGAFVSYREDLSGEAVNAQRVVTRMEAAGNGLNLVFLDACRDNPYPSSTKKSGFHQSGLNLMSGCGLLIGFAAAGNRPAFDSGNGSHYTNALLKHMATPHLDVVTMLTEVRKDVKYATNGGQEPFIYLGLDQMFCLSKTSHVEKAAEHLRAVMPLQIDSGPAKVKDEVNSLGMKFVPVQGTGVMFCEHETRVRDYAAFAEMNPGINMKWKDFIYKGHQQGPDHPVVNVTCEDAKDFCAWLSRKEGRHYRLPTDHEWSLAAGIGEQEDRNRSPKAKNRRITSYLWGSDWLPPEGVTNISGRESASVIGRITDYQDAHPFTAPVKSYPVEMNGLYDMSGNVGEFCEGWYSDDANYRVLRGASWSLSDKRALMTSSRLDVLSGMRYCNNGFRCVLSPD